MPCWGEVMPAEALDLTARPDETVGELRRASGGRAHEKVAHMSFDGSGFVKFHSEKQLI